jgi:hypothetical protein
VSELPLPGPDDLFRISEPEGDEEQARLVDVAVVAVYDVDLQLVLVVPAAQAVGEQRAAGAAAEDEESLGHDPSFTAQRA